MTASTGFPGLEDTRSRSTGRRSQRGTRSVARRAAVPGARTAAPAPLPGRRTRARVGLSALVMMFAAGLVATLALPSYAIDPRQQSDELNGRAVTASGEQRLKAVGEDVDDTALDRDSFSATTSAELLRTAYRQQFTAYSGPSAEDFLKNPAHPSFSLDAVYNTGLQYIGVPYVFGGANPSGFDCSGFIMFVYAQYGIALPHSVHAQDGIGTPIAEADAQPGDVVVFNDDSHDGFYAGNGMILHAPFPGARVRVQPIWTANVHFVRFGI